MEQLMYTDQDSTRKEFGTDYLAALDDWGGYKDAPGVIEKVTEIVKFCESELGPVSLAYVIASKTYIGMRFAENPLLALLVYKGHVDHRPEFPGSVKKKDEEFWRTELPTKNNSAATHKKIIQIKETLCNKCYGLYPAHLSDCPTCTGA
jgi:hypothetical protein